MTIVAILVALAVVGIALRQTYDIYAPALGRRRRRRNHTD